MKKLLILCWCFLVSSQAWADPEQMARDILKQVIHDPLNANADISDSTADKVVIVALRAAIITIACKQKYNSVPSRISSCLNANRAKILTIGDLGEQAFNVGNQTADAQATAHPEVSLGNYSIVINFLLSYVDNLSRNQNVTVPVK